MTGFHILTQHNQKLRSSRWWAVALALLAVGLFTTPLSQRSAQAQTNRAPTLSQLKNMTYINEFPEAGVAPLKEGEYREPAAPGSASEIVVQLTDHVSFGQLGESAAAAVVLRTNAGGSGVFYDLAIVVNQDGEPVNIATTLLGDRVNVRSLSIEQNGIVVTMATQGPIDPMCCPSQFVEQIYKLDGDTQAGNELTDASRVVVRRGEVGNLPVNAIEVDAIGLAKDVTGERVVAAPYDGDAPTGPTGAPEHNIVFFDGQPVIGIYPVVDYEKQWEEAGDGTVTQAINQLRQLLAAYDRGGPLPDAGLLSLPPSSAVNDLAVQTDYIDFANGRGVRYVGRTTEDDFPVTGDQLNYYFHGLTNDSRYYISLVFPVSVTNFPQTAADIPANVLKSASTDYLAYLAKTKVELDRLTSRAFDPSLAHLDAIVSSITINRLAVARDKGQLVVATSADYEPFAYYTSNFLLDGLDIALIREIGRRLDLEISIRDMAFEGLGDALYFGQIDLVIAALTDTPERRQFVDFSTPYYINEDAVLVREDSRLTATGNGEELKSKRIGVQRDSVYEEGVRAAFVDTDIISEDDFLVYQDIDLAVNDLLAGRIDLVVTDLAPAQAFVRDGGVKILTQGFSEQEFAIAFFPGPSTYTLRTEINEVLSDLDEEGFIAELIERYTGQKPVVEPPVVPVPTPAPTTPPPIATCTDGMEFVQDLNYDDNNMTAPPQIPPEQPFEKGWRVRNSGTCSWNSGYTLAYLSGNSSASRMEGQTIAMVGTVPPGQFYDFRVPLVAPVAPGIYQGFWGMQNSKGQPMGDRMWVGIEVPTVAAPTPQPTQTPTANIDFRADRLLIKQGECTTTSWKVENVQAVYFYEQGEPWEDHGVVGEDQRTVCPGATTTYELRIIQRNGTTEIRQMRITVESVVGVPEIRRFVVEPNTFITVGQCVTLRWEIEGNVTRVKLAVNNTAIWDSAPVLGTIQHCPPGTGEMVYVVEATGGGGTSRAQQVIQVVAVPPTPTATFIPPTPTFTPAPPTSTEAPLEDMPIVLPDLANLTLLSGLAKHHRAVQNQPAVSQTRARLTE
ncbi:transporter substrate-binding domain-containing protein [Chloroflexi bacterium TSY]|nr:transporter substrate-binding domain-containing protein [Chloroflexi bacterium TSY]